MVNVEINIFIARHIYLEIEEKFWSLFDGLMENRYADRILSLHLHQKNIC